MPPLEKYKDLVEFQPEIVLRVSVKDMAKYIGMRPDVLSRVREGVKMLRSFSLRVLATLESSKEDYYLEKQGHADEKLIR